MSGLTIKSALVLLVGLLIVMMNSCCIADLFEEDDDGILPHSEGTGGDV